MFVLLGSPLTNAPSEGISKDQQRFLGRNCATRKCRRRTT
jgi:hypothetical protein